MTSHAPPPSLPAQALSSSITKNGPRGRRAQALHPERSHTKSPPEGRLGTSHLPRSNPDQHLPPLDSCPPHSHTGISSLSHWDLLTLTLGSPHSHTGISSLTHWDLLTNTLGSPHTYRDLLTHTHWVLLTHTHRISSHTPGSPHTYWYLLANTHWDLLTPRVPFTHRHRDLLTHTCWDLLTHTQDSLPSYFPLDTTAGLYLGTISPVHSHPVP